MPDKIQRAELIHNLLILIFNLDKKQGDPRRWLRILHVGIRYSSMNPLGGVDR
jgi:hypothetical protein